MAGGLILVSPDSDTTQAVRAALQSSHALPAGDVCHHLPDLVLRLQREPARLALVDLDPDPSQTLERLEPIIARFHGTRFVLLTSTEQETLLLEAMNIGARYCLPKHAIPSQLQDVLHRFAATGNGTAPSLGRAISVFSASGGCGATTVAINLAHEMQLATAQPTLLVDMDWHYGGVASYLDLKSRFGLGDVLANPDPLDAELIRSTAQPCPGSQRLFALLSPTSTDGRFGAPPHLDRLDTTVAVCQMAYPWTVIDAPRQSLTTMVDLASASELSILVFQLCVKDVRTARQMLAGLARHDIPADRVLLVANRYRRRRHWISLDQAIETLGGAPIAYVSNDYAATARAGNFGQTIEQAARRSAIRKDLKRLITEYVLAAQTSA
ncbi:MAG: hypothetical protein WD118_11545 [Phycisphaeraceae bacterium]